MMLFFMFCLNSSNEIPCACAAFSRSSMDSACICLRRSSSRLTTSVSALMPSSSPFCSSSCWSELVTFLQQQLLVNEVAQQVFLAIFLFQGGGVGLILVHFRQQLLTGVPQVGTRDDAVVDTADDLLDHRVSLGHEQGSAEEYREQKDSKFLHEKPDQENRGAEFNLISNLGHAFGHFTASREVVPDKATRDGQFNSTRR